MAGGRQPDTGSGVAPRLVLGWEEWVSLPALGLPALKAKIDTGARTSALHAESVELLADAPIQSVRFTIRPAPKRLDIAVICVAPLIDRRSFTSSNGIPEERYVIETELSIAGRSWPIEISLSDRRDMTYRMLLGRQALRGGHVLIDPSGTRLQPRLGFKLYQGYRRRTQPSP